MFYNTDYDSVLNPRIYGTVYTTDYLALIYIRVYRRLFYNRDCIGLLVVHHRYMIVFYIIAYIGISYIRI